MDRVGPSGGKNRPAQRVGGRRIQRHNKVKQTVSVSNRDGNITPIVGTALVGSSLGATSAGAVAVLTGAPVVYCVGAGILAGAVVGALIKSGFQWLHSEEERFDKIYKELVEELQGSPAWAQLKQGIPDDVVNMPPDVRLTAMSRVVRAHDKYCKKTSYIEAQQMAKKILDAAGKDWQKKYPGSTLSALDDEYVKNIIKYIMVHNADNDFAFTCQTEESSAGVDANVDYYITRFPKGLRGEGLRKKWDSTLDLYNDDKRSNKASFVALLAYKDIPYLHVNPDLTRYPVRDDASQSWPSHRRRAVEELAVPNQLKKRFVCKNTGVGSPLGELVQGASKKQSKTNCKIVYGPTFARQEEEGFPQECINSLKKIEEDIQSGRSPKKSINTLHIYTVKMGDDKRKGRWRLLVEIFKTDQDTIYRFKEVCDYHTAVPTLWGRVKRHPSC